MNFGFDWASLSHNIWKEVSHTDAPWDGKPALTGLQMQTSSGALPVPIVYGQAKVAPNIIWYNDFHAARAKTGKGGAKGTGIYTYSASIILGICEGPINDVNNVWKNLYEKTDGTRFVSINGAVEFEGDYTQTPWSYVTTKHPDQALAYRGLAYLGIPNYNLGNQPQVPQHNFEVNGILYLTGVGGTVPDADPALMTQDFLTNENYGTPFRAACIDVDTLLSGPDAPTTGDGAYQTYCRALGFALSPTLSDPEAAADIITRWCVATNTDVVWSGDKLKWIPYGDEQISANGVVFNPVVDVRYNLTDEDYQYSEGDDPVTYERSDPADSRNSFFVKIMNRPDDYNLKPMPAKDQAAIEEFGLLQADPKELTEIKSMAHGDTIAHLLLNRSAYIRNKYTFKLSQRFIRLEAMDIVTLTEARLGMVLYPVRVIEVTEGDDGQFTVTAEDAPAGVSTTGVYNTQPSGAVIYNAADDPGDVNTPVIFEAPASLTNGVPQIWAIASGAAEFWGGCEVWLSTDDTTYIRAGVINPPTRQGLLTATLAAYGGANPDTAHTLSVDLTESKGELESGTALDASSFTTLCYVDGELLSYQTATLTGVNAYDLTTLYRGLYGTTPGAHLSGTQFARLDDSTFKFDLPQAFVGQPLYAKFPSFNTWGNSLQDLSTLTPVVITPSGTAWTIAPPATCVVTPVAVTLPDGSASINLNIDITPSPGGQLIDRYEVQVAPTPYSAWVSAPSITPGDTRSVFNGAAAATLYEARARAVRTSGQSIQSSYTTSAPVNSGSTTSAAPNIATSLVATGGTGGNYLTWGAPAAGAQVQSYQVWAIHGSSGVFASAVKIGTVNGSTLQFFHGGLGNTDTWRYWIVAANSTGSAPELGPQNATTSAGGGGGGGVSPFWATAPTIPTVSGLTLVKGGSTTATLANSTRGFVLSVTRAASGDRGALASQAPPSGSGAPFVMTALFVPAVGSKSFDSFGLYVKDATGKIQQFCYVNATIGNQKWTTLDLFSASVVVASNYQSGSPLWMKLELTSTDLVFSTSVDGENWMQIQTVAKANFVGTITECGVELMTNPTTLGASLPTSVHVMSYSCV